MVRERARLFKIKGQNKGLVKKESVEKVAVKRRTKVNRGKKGGTISP